MLSRWQGGLGAAAVTLVACGLVVLDMTDPGFGRWWVDHALTTAIVSGLLVLLITALVVDQVIRLRQVNDQARAVAVQVAIMVTQANRAFQAVSRAQAGSGTREVANDEFRTYTLMLLAAAPVLIDDKVSRGFLEQAQRLDGEIALALRELAGRPARRPAWATGLDDAVQGLRSAAAPLLQNLDPEMRSAVRGNDPA